MKIAILGVENSHADAFGKLVKEDPKYRDIEIVGIYSDDEEAVKRAVKIGACNIYHGCVHNMLYEKSEDILRGLYKSASFVMQAIAFRQTGRYIRHQADLLQIVGADDREVVGIFMDMKKGATIDFHKASHILFEWAKKQIVSANG